MNDKTPEQFKQEEAARVAAEENARKEAEAKAKADADEKAKKEAEEKEMKDKAEADRKAAEEKAKKDKAAAEEKKRKEDEEAKIAAAEKARKAKEEEERKKTDPNRAPRDQIPDRELLSPGEKAAMKDSAFSDPRPREGHTLIDRGLQNIRPTSGMLPPERRPKR